MLPAYEFIMMLPNPGAQPDAGRFATAGWRASARLAG